MASVSENIVREFFELHGFLVRQQRKYVAPLRHEEEEIDFFVWNPQVESSSQPRPFVLGSRDVSRLERAIVVVKGWHTETFTPGVVASAPEIFRFVGSSAFRPMLTPGTGREPPPARILVLPALPVHEEARRQSVELLRSKGIDGVIAFRTMLADLIDQVEANRNYQKSDLLQVLRILKNYDFIKEPQLDLFKLPRRRRAKGLSGPA